MNKVYSYKDRIAQISANNRSFIILALDLESRYQNIKYIENLITNLNPFLCAIKINFHLLLPFSKKAIQNINRFIHSYGLISIADIKLNDVTNTNHVTLRHLHSMGFDSVIVNPIIGLSELKSLVRLAHNFGMGVISLVYTSHRSVKEGYGLNVVQKGLIESKVLPMFEIFLQYASKSRVDGIIVGATDLKTLKYITSITRIPIYSPGVGTQGGNPKSAIENGSNYIIIGRSILNSRDKQKTLSILLKSNEI